MFVAAELFSGGGGLAVGLTAAGFKTVAAVEINPHATATFRANHANVHVFESDITNVNAKDILDLAHGKLDVLAACPPCQGFSSLTAKWRRSDPRNSLVTEVARFAERLRPRAIMIENVPGLADKGRSLFESLIVRLEAAGYVCNWDILQVADFGVPQYRKRLVLLAGLGFKIELPAPTHCKTGCDGREKWLTVHDAIGKEVKSVKTWAEVKHCGGGSSADWHIVRNMSEDNRRRLQYTRPGGKRSDLPVHLRPKCHKGDYNGFTNVYGRLRWHEPAATITAGCLSISKGRFGHPDQDRTISLREAALLQTFPRDYRFETPYIDRAAEIVGNALPCRFAAAIAQSVALTLRYLDGYG